MSRVFLLPIRYWYWWDNAMTDISRTTRRINFTFLSWMESVMNCRLHQEINMIILVSWILTIYSTIDHYLYAIYAMVQHHLLQKQEFKSNCYIFSKKLWICLSPKTISCSTRFLNYFLFPTRLSFSFAFQRLDNNKKIWIPLICKTIWKIQDYTSNLRAE